MKSGSPRNTARALVAPSLDFNPRDLVVTWTPSRLSPVGHADIDLQAIYVPSKCRAEHVYRLLGGLHVSDATVYVLPTLASDIPSALPAQGPRLEHLGIQDPEFFWALRGLRCVSNPVFAISEADWDLPLKRNYALWHAHKHGFRRILLLDDDIRGLDGARLLAGASALSRWVLAGFFVDDFPDTSVVGHVKRAVGEPLRPFLSGSCLFVRTDVAVGFFSPIYNEDWIFMAPEIEQGNVCSLVSSTKRPMILSPAYPYPHSRNQAKSLQTVCSLCWQRVATWTGSSRPCGPRSCLSDVPCSSRLQSARRTHDMRPLLITRGRSVTRSEARSALASSVAGSTIEHSGTVRLRSCDDGISSCAHH